MHTFLRSIRARLRPSQPEADRTGFDPHAYWLNRGKTYERDFSYDARYTEQEKALAAILGRLDFTSVLEVGCGFGRIGEVVERLRPGIDYTGLDISPDQLDGARRRLPSATLIASPLEDFQPDRRWDLVLAVEFLLHVPPDRIEEMVAKLKAMSAGHVVTLDWDTPVKGRIAPHNWRHDYQRWLGPRRVAVSTAGIYHWQLGDAR